MALSSTIAHRGSLVFTFTPVAHVRTPYAERTAVPRGLGAKHEAEGVSHLFAVWVFDRSEGYELLGPNPTDGKEHGVFATRSPRRPNPIALTVVELLSREGAKLHVRGVDMLDGTPVLDIKPYLSGIPAEKLRRGWLDEAEAAKQRN